MSREYNWINGCVCVCVDAGLCDVAVGFALTCVCMSLVCDEQAAGVGVMGRTKCFRKDYVLRVPVAVTADAADHSAGRAK